MEPAENEESLDLGELHQVLQDEELARKLQEEVEKFLRRVSGCRKNGESAGSFVCFLMFSMCHLVHTEL